MLAIEIKFPSGHFHATPWEHHVNEGIVEWPPSPWRLCRAILSIWHRHGEICSEQDMQEIIELMSQPPAYHVPVSKNAHTRHYMPRYTENPAKIFDTFVVVRKEDSLQIVWENAHPSDSCLNHLNELLGRLNYLGRSESWVTASIIPDTNVNEPNVQPLSDWEFPEETEPLRLMHPMNEENYSSWRETFLKENPKEKKAVPETVFHAMNCGVDLMKKHKWSRFPGSRWVLYGAKWPESEIPESSVIFENQYNLAIYELSSSVIPSVEKTLYIGERFRQGLMAGSRDSNNTVSKLFSGKDTHGNPMNHNHNHAYFLPVDMSNDGKLDHLIVWSPEEFSERELRSISSLSRLWGENHHDLLLGFQAVTSSDAVNPHHDFIGRHKTWISATPYFLTRYPKFFRRRDEHGQKVQKVNDRGFQIDGIEDQIIREANQKGFPEPDITIIDSDIQLHGNHRSIPWYRFASRRKNGKPRPELPGIVLKLHFPEPIQGPVSLGYGAHFGLGLFRGVRE